MRTRNGNIIYSTNPAPEQQNSKVNLRKEKTITEVSPEQQPANLRKEKPSSEQKHPELVNPLEEHPSPEQQNYEPVNLPEEHPAEIPEKQPVSAINHADSFVHNFQDTDADFYSDSVTAYKRQQPIVLYAVIGVLALIIIIVLVLFFSYIRNHQTRENISVESIADAQTVTEQSAISETITDIPVTETSVQSDTVQETTEAAVQTDAVQQYGILLSEHTGTSSEKIDQDFYQILQNSDAPAGYLYDINHDGNTEMILKDTQNMQFILYMHNASGDLYMYTFGAFLAWGDDGFYDVTGNDGSHYLYYRDDYNQTSAQGYYDPYHDNRLDIGIHYQQTQAKWAIFSNDTQVDTGIESVTDIYAQPDKCHASLMKYLDICGFPIDENSDYTKITMLYYDDLCQKTGGIPETVPVTQAPEISCEIKVQGSAQYDGYSYTLYVSGEYDYYYIECYEYDDGSPNDAYPVLSGTQASSELYLTAGSSLDRVTASVTPYYSDGTQGKTVSCTAYQPEYVPPVQAVTNVSKPADAVYIGDGTPVSGDGFLNLRSSKSTSSDSNIITAIPNGATLEIYALSSSDWYYVVYGSYSGYVKKSYTKLYEPLIGDSNSVDVYYCDKKGEINGSHVTGYASSYIVDCGNVAVIRERLGDRWHVTASRYCYSQGGTWYELYDSDDGDYYGWVNVNDIYFY